MQDEDRRERMAVRLCKKHPLAMCFGLAFTLLILSPGVVATWGLLSFAFEGTILTRASGLGLVTKGKLGV